MAKHKGKNGVVKVGSVVIGEVKSFEVTTTANEVDTSTMGSDWTSVESTQLSWKGSMELFWDPLDPGQAAIGVGSQVTVNFYPQGEASGLVLYSGLALVTSNSKPQSFNNIVESTIEFTGNGSLTQTQVI